MHPTTTSLPVDPSDQGHEPLLAWLSDHFHDLADEGHQVISTYWRELRILEDQRPYQKRATLGLRMRLRDNLALSLEWYIMGTLGRNKRSIATQHIPKGRNQDTYSLKALMRKQPSWLTDLVDSTEQELSRIRTRQTRLIRIRDAVGDFVKIDSGQPATGSQLMTRYLAREPAVMTVQPLIHGG